MSISTLLSFECLIDFSNLTHQNLNSWSPIPLQMVVGIKFIAVEMVKSVGSLNILEVEPTRLSKELVEAKTATQFCPEQLDRWWCSFPKWRGVGFAEKN